jgi:DNA-binding MarR family transcriptional regulator
LPKEIIHKIRALNTKMRIFRARLGGDSDIAKLNDRQLLMLEMLDSQKQMSIGQLGQSFKGVSQSAISIDIKSLRLKKLVQKKFSPADDRIHLIELTRTGKKKVEEIQQQALDSYLPLTNAIGKTNLKELDVFNSIVDRIINELDKMLYPENLK